jgi:hypothetical protein
MPKDAKATKLETEKRVFTIQGWILSGVPDYLILKNIEQTWSVGTRQAKNLRQKAYAVWHDDQEATIEQKRALRIDELKQDIRNMRPEFKGTPKGMAVVNAIKKEITKLEALYPATRHIIQGDPDKPLVISDSTDRDKRIAQLIAKAMQQDEKNLGKK